MNLNVAVERIVFWARSPRQAVGVVARHVLGQTQRIGAVGLELRIRGSDVFGVVYAAQNDVRVVAQVATRLHVATEFRRFRSVDGAEELAAQTLGARVAVGKIFSYPDGNVAL